MNISIWVPSILVKSPKYHLLKTYQKRKGQLVLYSLKSIWNVIYSPYRVFTCSKKFFCIFLNIKVCLDSCHNLLYIWICQERQNNISFKNCILQRTWKKVLLQSFDLFIWIDPISNSKLCWYRFECTYIILECFLMVFFNFMRKCFGY